MAATANSREKNIMPIYTWLKIFLTILTVELNSKIFSYYFIMHVEIEQLSLDLQVPKIN